jgi:hypothetical protein
VQFDNCLLRSHKLLRANGHVKRIANGLVYRSSRAEKVASNVFNDAYPSWGNAAYRLALQILLPVVAVAILLGAVAIIGKSAREIISWVPTAKKKWSSPSTVVDRCILNDSPLKYEQWRGMWAEQFDEVRDATDKLMKLLRNGDVIARGHRVSFAGRAEQNAEKETTYLLAGDWLSLSFFGSDYGWATRPGSLDKIVDLEMAIVRSCR